MTFVQKLFSHLQLYKSLNQVNISNSNKFMTNMFNVLYHRYIEQIKLQQIQTYNNNHNQYLKRCGKKLNPQSSHNNFSKKYQSNKSNEQRPIKAKSQRVGQQNIQNYPKATFDARQQQNMYTMQPTQQKNRHIKNKFTNQQQRPIKPTQALKNQPQQFQSSNFQRKNADSYQNDKNYTDKQNDSQNQYQEIHNQYQKQRIISNQPQQRTIKPTINKKNIDFTSQYPQQQENIVLQQCPEGCGRKFNPQALQKHVKVCQKVFQAKRKAFKVEIVDDQAKKLAQKGEKSNPKNQTNNTQKIPKWKKQSQSFRRGLQSNKQGGPTQSLPAEEQDDRILCGGCGRKFNEKAAQKHIPSCIKRSKQKK